MSKSSKKHPLIVYSGGIDSTYLLYSELKKGDVYTCYIEGAQSQDKARLEQEGRAKNITILEKLTGNRVLSDTIVKTTTTWTARTSNGNYVDNGNCAQDGTWGQAHQWLNGILYVSNSDKHSSIQMGHVLGDCISIHLGSQKKAWKYIQRFTKNAPIPLEFPLAMYEKFDLMYRMPYEVIANIWVCELPKKHFPEGNEIGEFQPCRCCSACITFMQADLAFLHRHDKDFKTHFFNWSENRRETGTAVDLNMSGKLIFRMDGPTTIPAMDTYDKLVLVGHSDN